MRETFENHQENVGLEVMTTNKCSRSRWHGDRSLNDRTSGVTTWENGARDPLLTSFCPMTLCNCSLCLDLCAQLFSMYYAYSSLFSQDPSTFWGRKKTPPLFVPSVFLEDCNANTMLSLRQGELFHPLLNNLDIIQRVWTAFGMLRNRNVVLRPFTYFITPAEDFTPKTMSQSEMGMK